MSELITKQQAIDAIGEIHPLDYNAQAIKARIEKLPGAEPEVFEWCDTCKEYDKEKYCCHRWTKVIKRAVDDISERNEIIYCKDCEYFKREIPCVGGVYNGCEKWLDNGNEIEVGEYDWCSKRKRKSNG